MKKNYLVAGVIILAAVGVFFVIQGRTQSGGQVACTMEAKLCPDGSSVGRQGPKCEFAPCPGEIKQVINLESPKENDEIGLPLTLSGTASVFDNIFGYRLVNADGLKLLEGFIETHPASGSTSGPFSLSLNYPDAKTKTGTLEVMTFAPVGGEVLDTTSIPIRFAPVDAAEVKVYFNNTKKDPKSLSCATTYPTVRRVAKTDATPAEAIREMLRGVSGIESDLGFMTAMNPGVELKSLLIENGVARADFNEALIHGVGGACRVSAIRSQIEHTLKQFPSVRSVTISVNGRSQDILQP